jgi:protein ImuB
MLWLGLYFPHLPLAVFSADETFPLAVTRRDKGREIIDRCNQLAQEQGITAGMPLNTALSLSSDLQVCERDRQCEQQMLENLADWGWQYSSRISFDPLLLLLEVGSSLKLFGGIELLLGAMREHPPLADGFQYWAVAASPAAASLLARFRPGSCITQPGRLSRQLADIPLRYLTRQRAVRELIKGIGLSSVGDCLQLPKPELARRAGTEFVLLLDKLLGKAPDPRPLWKPSEVFEQRLLLLHDISHSGALLFPARRLLESLGVFLRARDAVTQQLRWQFLHRDTAPSVLQQGLLEPGRDVERILEIFCQSLERLILPEAVVEIILQVDEWQAVQKQTDEMFTHASTHQDSAFLDRLRARMGDDAIQAVRVLPDHRPESAWEYREPVLPEHSVSATQSHQYAQPAWLLPQSLPLPLRQGMPCYQGQLQLQGKSQRIESGWWDGHDVQRDYYRAINPAGRKCWIYRDRQSGNWFLQGFFD